MEYIEIEKELIPYQFEIGIDGESFEFHVNYNKTHDFFTIDLYKNDDPLVLGEKLVYNQPLFATSQYKAIPKTPIVPFDMAGSVSEITFENLGEQVFLFLVGD